jgi:hypothetical protein
LQTATLATLDLSNLTNLAPVDFYLCYSPNGTSGLFFPAIDGVKFRILAPGVNASSVTQAPANTVIGRLTLVGEFGRSPPKPVIAFSPTAGQCTQPLLLPRPAFISADGSVCFSRLPGCSVHNCAVIASCQNLLYTAERHSD